MPKPSSMNFFSASGECTSSTSASPFWPMVMACPEPTAIVLTTNPDCFSNAGTSTSSRPVSCVLVVVARIRFFSWAAAGAAASRAAAARVRTAEAMRFMRPFPFAVSWGA